MRRASDLTRWILRLIAVLGTGLAPAALAGEGYQFYRGVRPLGMGGAGLATVNDETALLVNPAALTKLRDNFVTVADPEVDAGFDAFRINGGSPTKMGDPGHARGQLNRLQDHHYHQRAQVSPSVVFPGFGIGVFAKQAVDAEITSKSKKYLYDFTQDVAAVTGFGVRAFGGVVKLGATARLDSRREVRRADLDPNATDLSLDALAVEGAGLGADAALMVSAPVELLPTLAVVYRDIGHTSFTLMNGLTHPTSARPRAVRDALDLGVAIYPIYSRALRATWSVEYDDAVAGPSDPLRHLHAGVEWNYGDAVFVRAGINQRYWTLGLECAFAYYQVQLASYGEDIGDATSGAREDRRAVGKVSWRF